MDNLTPFGVGFCGLALLSSVPTDPGTVMELLKEIGSTGILAGVLYYVLKKHITATERLIELVIRNGTAIHDLDTKVEILHHIKEPKQVLQILEKNHE